MQISVWIVTAIILLIMFGAGQRILDKLRLSDKWAIAILVAIIIGIIIPPIKISNMFSFSIGGFLIPFGLCVYLLIRAGWSMDLVRAFAGTIITAGVVLLLEIFLPSKTPEDILIDNTYLYGIVAGLVAYLLGRSRRNAFVCSVFGLTLASVAIFVYNLSVGVETKLALGVGGAFDSIILSILIAVGLAELIGKTAEIIVGKDDKVYDFNLGEFADETYISSEEKAITDSISTKKDGGSENNEK